ncbi:MULTISPECIES: acyltransferase [unclassified Microbacterium]|uniref:acyltransferase n=1 Tax=unclassified Microbacterium TaxID=2609290 RepID=UPI000CFB3E79|nr:MULTISPECIES: acyltransferase [unclassified Microbacterium]PRB12784.1 acyltransferase [Microbacterium sp. MYb72]
MLDQLPDRSGAIDLVRLLAVAAIVAGHAFTKDVTQAWLYSWHVAVFFILTGYLWKPGRMLRTEVFRRALSLGRPYVAAFAVLTAVLLIVKPVDALHTIAGGVEGGRFAQMPYVTLWFVSALFFTAVVFRAMERLPYAAQWGIGIAGALAAWAWSGPLSRTPLGIGYIATCLLYLLVGDALRRVRDRIAMPLVSGVVALTIGAALVAVGAAAPLDIKLGDDGTPAVSALASSAIAIGLILVAESVVRPGRFSRACTLLALPLLTVVLLHPLVLWLGAPPWAQFALGILVPLALGLVALRTPLSPWITGQTRVRGARAIGSAV